MEIIRTLILCILLQQSLFANDMSYTHIESGMSFNYTDTLILNKKSSKEKPLSIVFTYGNPPFTSSVFFKELEGDTTLENFIKEEHARQVLGGYKSDVVEKKSVLNGETDAIEFVRKTPFGMIYYFVFSSNKNGHLYSFYHVTSNHADPDKNALKAYQQMKKSLRLKK